MNNDEESIEHLGTLEAMRRIAMDAVAPEEFDAEPGSVLVIKDDQRVVDLERYADAHAEAPKRPYGTSRHHTLESLIAHAVAHRNGQSVAFVDAQDNHPSMEVVYNYHPPFSAGTTDGGWCDHRAMYAFPVSDQWKRWAGAAGKSLRVEDFARLLEDGIGDVWDPASAPTVPKLQGVQYATPSELLALADGLTVNIAAKVGESKRLDNGTHQLTMVEEHETVSRAGAPIRVPNAFIIGIPVFVGGSVYGLPVRLRYRVTDRVLTWSLLLHNAAEAVREAVNDAAKAFREQVQMPTYFGKPEGSVPPATHPDEDDE